MLLQQHRQEQFELDLELSSNEIGSVRRRLSLPQLLDNLGALAVSLSSDQTRRLDEVSEPSHSFPHPFLAMVQPCAIQGGVRVNDVVGPRAEFLPATPEDRW